MVNIFCLGKSKRSRREANKSSSSGGPSADPTKKILLSFSGAAFADITFIYLSEY